MKEKTFQEFDIPLHDIKPIMEVDEFSLYYLIGTIGIGLLLAIGFIYLLYIWYKKSKIVSTRLKHKKLLDSLDINDTKNTAYALSSYGLTFEHDSEKHEEIYNNLSQKLQEYKYKKDVDKFNRETLFLIDEYRAIVNV